MNAYRMIVLASLLVLPVGCGTQSPEAAHPAASASLVRTQADISSDLALEDLQTEREAGWLVLSWSSPAAGTAWLTVDHENGLGLRSVRLQLKAGRAAVVINPGHEIMKLGQVSGQPAHVCGPQGAQCESEIPTAPLETRYPCGPQGATCSVSVPSIVKAAYAKVQRN